MSAVAEAFDRAAPDYDAGFGVNPLAVRLRDAFRRRLLARVPPGGSVLDLGCGTGEDALLLAELGRRVVALDPSSQMVALARAKARARGLGAERLAVVQGIAEEADRLGAGFDAAYSDFGALNCADLARVGSALRAALRPGAPVLFSLMGPAPLPATALRWLLRRGAARGGSAPRVGGVPVAVRYPWPAQARAELGAGFRWSAGFALGVILPEPSHAAWCRAHPRATALLAALEGRVRGWPLLRALGDHYVLDGERA